MSKNNERLCLAIDDLQRFIKYMARIESVVGGHWFLNRDDLESEAYLLLINLVNRYEFTSYDDFLKLCKRSIVNKFKSFKGKYLKSTRRHDHYAISFEDIAFNNHYTLIPFSDVIGVYSENPFYVVIDTMSENLRTSSLNPANDISELYKHLTEFDCAILDCLLGKNSRVPAYLYLVMLRSKFRNPEKPIRINEYIISKALCCSKIDVTSGFDRIKQIILERGIDVLEY